MKITDIKQQVKRADRYSIHLDDKYIFSLSESELLNTGLRINQEVSEDDLESLRAIAKIDKATDSAYNYLSMRPRSEWELRTYLNRKDHDEETIDLILNKLMKSKYIDDSVFAKTWVENRRLLKSVSKRKLSLELKVKRVSDEIIRDVLENDETDELSVLKELVGKKRHISRYQDPVKLTRYLIGQGYNYQDIKTVLAEEN